jgi:hypothetical protein
MTYTLVFTTQLPPDLLEQVEQWGRDIQLTRDELIEKLLRLGLGRAVRLQPSQAKAAVRRRARKAEGENWVRRAADAAEARSRATRKTTE